MNSLIGDARVAVLGSLNSDHVLRVTTLPRPGETVLAKAVSRVPGGKGANQAVAAARAGALVRMLGAVGDDDDGRALVAALAAEGVDVTGVGTIAAATGAAYVSVCDAGENQIVVVGGANLLVEAGIGRSGAERVRLASLETPFDAVRGFFATAGGACVKILNAAPFTAPALSLFPGCDMIVLNQSETASACGRATPFADRGDAIEAAQFLAGQHHATIIVTLGAMGAIAVSGTDCLIAEGRDARVVDTTGAGDCFCGVLAARIARGSALGEAINRANTAAALAVTRRGTFSAMPRLGPDGNFV